MDGAQAIYRIQTDRTKCGGVEGCDNIVEDNSVSIVGEVVSTDLGASSN